jgi:hypothetical protein
VGADAVIRSGDRPARTLASLSRWIDEHPSNAVRDGEAATWGRIAKVAEEAGEVVAAMIALTGQNPCKPQAGSLADVERELLDVAVTALAAVEHLHGNDGSSLAALAGHLDRLAVRAGLTVE